MNESNHVERKPGQRYSLWDSTVELERLRTEGEYWAGEWSAHWVERDGVNVNVPCVLTESNLCEAVLLSDAPALLADKAPDRTGCKAWCGAAPASPSGELYQQTDDSVFNGRAFAPNGFSDWDAMDPRNVRWCSQACKDRKVGPLPATPVTTGAKHADNCADHGGYACTCGVVLPAANDLGTGAVVKASRPVAAGETPVPVTCGSNGTTHGGAVLMRHFKKASGYRCDACFVALEKRHGSRAYTNVLRDDKLPDLIDRRMQFSPFDDSCLEDAP